MGLIALRCPSCGGAVKADAEARRGWCPFCNTEFLIETALEGTVTIEGESLDDKLKNAEQLWAFGERWKAQHAYEEITRTRATDYRGWLGLARTQSNGFTELRVRSTLSGRDPQPGNFYVPDQNAMTCLARAESLAPDAAKQEIARLRYGYCMKAREKNLEHLRKEIRQQQEVIAKDNSSSPEVLASDAKGRELDRRIRQNDRSKAFYHPAWDIAAELRIASVCIFGFLWLMQWIVRSVRSHPVYLVMVAAAVLFALYAWIGRFLYQEFDRNGQKLWTERNRQSRIGQDGKVAGERAEQARKALEQAEERLHALEEQTDRYIVE